VFKKPLMDISANEMEDWLRSMEIGPRTRKNYRTAIATMTAYAKARGYVPRDWNEIENIQVGKIKKENIHIFAPHELERLLNAAPEKALPIIALGAFAGVRLAEITRLDWSAINFESGFITVEAHAAKTARRRLIPILPALKSWLEPIVAKTGPICVYAFPANSLMDYAKTAGIKWHQNILRHSFISYRLADIQNINQVALEAGNSSQMIFSNYRELTTPAKAASWFRIFRPTTAPLSNSQAQKTGGLDTKQAQ